MSPEDVWTADEAERPAESVGTAAVVAKLPRPDDGVIAYSVGLVCISACYPNAMSPAEVAAELSAMYPTGLGHGWTPAKDQTFSNGSPNPCPCEHTTGRSHGLFSC